MKQHLILTILLTPLLSHAEDWPHWRGQNRDDVTTESSGWPMQSWPGKSPSFTANVGVGCNSPLVVDGKVYALGWRSNRDVVTCLDVKSGKPIWSQSYKAPLYARNSMGDKRIYAGPSSTPEYDTSTHYLYTLSLDGDLHCWNARKKGEKVWHINLYDLYKAPMRPQVNRSGRRDYGYTSSPLVQGETLIVEVGSKKGNVMGFDKRTGKLLWTSKANDPAGHNGGPVPITVEGVPCVAVLNHNGLLVVRIDKGREGETVARYPWLTEWANNIATPAVHENTVLITSNYNFKKICKVEITLKGAKKLWESDYSSKACSPVIHKGYVYWVWRTVHCLDFKTGKRVWEIRSTFGNPGSCIVTSDDRLIVWGKRGRLLLADTATRSPKKPNVLALRDRITRHDSWPHAVLADGRLLLKDKQGNLLCFDLSGKR